MTSVAAFSTVVFVVATSVRAQRAPLPHQSNFIPKAVAYRWHDQKELGGGGDADARRHQLRAEPTAAWRVWARHGHAAHSDKEALRVRTRLLQDKLRLAAKRVKREVKGPGQKPEYVWVAPRAKKGAEDKWEPDRKGPPSMELHFYNPDIFFPENIAALENETGPYQEILRKERKKRPKREAAVFWAGERTGRALELQRVKRTTANPFIPDTNIEDYQIGSADTAEQYVPDTGSAPALTDSFVMNEDASEFSKIISDFYLTTSSEFWPEIQRFAENVLKPISPLPVGLDPNGAVLGFDIMSWKWDDRTDDERLANKRVKRRVDKTLKRKRAKKRAQKRRRMDRKRLRMLTHAKRVRKQQKRRQARLERHYALMNSTRNMTMPWDKGYNGTRGLAKTGVDESRPVESRIETAEIDMSGDSVSEYAEDSDDDDSDGSGSYEEEDSSGSEVDSDDYDEYEESNSDCEDIDYENVTNQPKKPADDKKKRIKSKKCQKTMMKLSHNRNQRQHTDKNMRSNGQGDKKNKGNIFTKTFNKPIVNERNRMTMSQHNRQEPLVDKAVLNHPEINKFLGHENNYKTEGFEKQKLPINHMHMTKNKQILRKQ